MSADPYQSAIAAAQARLDVALAQRPSVLALKQAHYAECIHTAKQHNNDHCKRNFQQMQMQVLVVQAASA